MWPLRVLGLATGLGVRNMNGGHYIAFILLFALGYLVARVWPAPGQAVGLP
jgi:hypothetical protein